MKNIILVVFCCIIPFSSFAHKDKRLQLLEDGTLVGLPKKYAPARFEMQTFVLSIGKNKLKIPECIKENFKNPEISFSASWYHNLELIPCYLNLKISTSDKPNSFEILVNLDTLEIIKIQEKEMISDKKNKSISFKYTPVIISNRCKDSTKILQ